MPRRSYEAIRKQIEKLEAQARKLEEAAQQKKKQAVAQVVALMKKLGVSLEDMAGARPRRSRRRASRATTTGSEAPLRAARPAVRRTDSPPSRRAR
ncbi:MAG: hypothetical protein DCC70_12770 [Burkholderiales bacterium]|nr:MAG: hypothetical protein DCC70_12770 [Burkholderiales bacterium]